MKARDLRDRTTEDLAELEKSLAAERFQNKFKNFTNRLDDTSLIRKQKRDLARVKLILTERSRGITVIGKPQEAGAEKPKRVAKPVVQKSPSAAAAEGAETESTSEKTTAKAKAAKTETKPAAEKKTKTAAAKPAAKKAKAKEETK
jgi:large subunit ribosomal protein L29